MVLNCFPYSLQLIHSIKRKDDVRLDSNRNRNRRYLQFQLVESEENRAENLKDDIDDIKKII